MKASYILAGGGAFSIFASLAPWGGVPSTGQKWADAFYLAAGIGLMVFAILRAIAAVMDDLHHAGGKR